MTNKMPSILIVEDDQDLNEGLVLSLNTLYKCQQAYNCQDAKRACLCNKYDLILLDVNLPDGMGIDLCKWMKDKSRDQKIIFISANDTEGYILSALESGGEDYITKPFSLAVLKAKIKIVLNRGADDKTANISLFGELKVDHDKGLVYKKDELIKLTATEYKLMDLLIQNKSQVMTRGMILERLWDAEGNFVDENALSVNVRRLRKKVEDNPSKPSYIKTVFGIGYIWGDMGEGS